MGVLGYYRCYSTPKYLIYSLVVIDIIAMFTELRLAADRISVFLC